MQPPGREASTVLRATLRPGGMLSGEQPCCLSSPCFWTALPRLSCSPQVVKHPQLSMRRCTLPPTALAGAMLQGGRGSPAKGMLLLQLEGMQDD